MAELPLRYVNLAGVADQLGVSRQRVSQLWTTGQLPAPDALYGTRPLWLVERITRFTKARRAAIAKVPVGVNSGFKWTEG